MKVTETSQKALQFQGAHFGKPIFSDTGVQIHFVEMDNWLRVLIEVGEDTTSDNLREVIPLALSWRDRLLEWQGPWFHGGDNLYLEEISMRQEAGESYSQLAEAINNTITANLVDFHKLLQEFEQMRHQPTTAMEFHLWNLKHNRFSYEHARGLLEGLRFDSGEIETLLQAGIESLQAGEPAFEKGYPVSREKLISVLRVWRQGRKHNLIKEKFFGPEDGS
jgi:hypothetical protein